MAKKNMLSNIHAYSLTKWIEENKASFDKLTQMKIAEIASTQLGFPVTTSNVYGASNVLGIKLGQREVRQNIFAKTKDSHRVIAKHLVHLYTKLGEPVPQALQEIANR